MQIFGFDRFTQNAKKILSISQKIAQDMGSGFIDTEHVLLAILGEKVGMAHEILSSYGVDFERIEMASSLVPRKDIVRRPSGGIGDDLKKSLERAILISKKYGHFYLGSEHLLGGIIASPEFRAYQLIQNIDINPEKITKKLDEVFDSAPRDRVMPPSDDEMMVPAANMGPKREKKSMPGTYAVDLTEQAEKKSLDPVIGREKETARIIHILTRRTKNNPVLIGDPGVGKTAIVEGLASMISEGNVPIKLKNKRILSLDLGAMIAGTKFRGEFEDRLKKLIKEVEKNKNIILFIDEVHTVIGAGAAEGSMDAGNMLKPALSRGRVTCIGATTIEEYRKNIEKDLAFERRFQPVIVEESTVEDTVGILEGIAENYEDFHQVSVDKEAIRMATKLSHRYIQDRFLPDKAIDILDEACSAVVIKERVGESEEIRKLEKRLAATMEGKNKAISEQAYEVAASLSEAAHEKRPI